MKVKSFLYSSQTVLHLEVFPSILFWTNL